MLNSLCLTTFKWRLTTLPSIYLAFLSLINIHTVCNMDSTVLLNGFGLTKGNVKSSSTISHLGNLPAFCSIEPHSCKEQNTCWLLVCSLLADFLYSHDTPLGRMFCHLVLGTGDVGKAWDNWLNPSPSDWGLSGKDSFLWGNEDVASVLVPKRIK